MVKKNDPPLEQEGKAKEAEDKENQPGEPREEPKQDVEAKGFLASLLKQEDKIRETASDKEKTRGPIRVALTNIADGISHLRSAIAQVEAEGR